ncbi:hypothetical protein CCACVL1_14565 [Corchorus capsularis]|uniref:Uncharacterized protein n=1 Tax=Corchorus capsularis TaxID=210143 RepID=A0A1R3I6K2_COCAP|nr:hypothetical protein CCACVL1_14565 [Corchorus capsularis]
MADGKGPPLEPRGPWGQFN